MGSKVLWGTAVGTGALALGLLTACSGGAQAGGTTAPPPTGDFTSVTSAAANAPAGAPTGAPANSGTVTASTAVSRCHTSDLSAKLGKLVSNANTGSTVELFYTNKSGHVCTMDGYGGVDLHGPADPNGSVFSLRRDPDVQGRDANQLPKPTKVTLAPGGTAHTVITFGRWEPGDVGSLGSTKWVPTEIVSTPPNETTQLTTPWPSGIPVLRDDSATVSHSYLSPIESDA